jgi:DNA (cytosine-5)-methyltransferase 1
LILNNTGKAKNKNQQGEKLKKQMLEAADLFCGAGGLSEGLEEAVEEQGNEIKLTAINHWGIAIETHRNNHPKAIQLCESADNVNPRKVVPGGKLDILVASPECIMHSRARGGRPINDQSRASAWHVLRWAEALYIKNILVENVSEFKDWAPLGADGKPLKSKKGETFKAFITALKSLGYNVDYKILNAADYGDPTSRKRLFILARRGKRVKWPTPTHTVRGDPTLLGPTKKWRSAREIIDWKLEGKSIFDRKKPLSENTMKRIVAGLKKFCSKDLEPFIVMLQKNNTGSSIDKPIPTITSVPKVGLCNPFIVEFYGNGQAQTVDKPVPTITTKDRFGICEPFVVRFTQTGGGDAIHNIDNPVPTICTKQELAVVEPSLKPFIIRTSHNEFDKSRVRSTDDPLPTVITKVDLGLCEPFIMRTDQTGQLGPGVKSINSPLPTILTNPGLGLVEPFIVPQFGEHEKQEPRVHSIDKPLPTVTSHGAGALVMPEFNGQRLDIKFRMLTPEELAAAMSFDKNYSFAGKREDVVKQIGNAVPVNLAKHLCLALLED